MNALTCFVFSLGNKNKYRLCRDGAQLCMLNVALLALHYALKATRETSLPNTCSFFVGLAGRWTLLWLIAERITKLGPHHDLPVI